MIKRLLNDLKKYKKYIAYSTKSQLKAEVTNSYLSWIWLFLEPICFMLIYTFIALVVFNSGEDYFAVFVFIGLTVWSLFQKTLIASVRLVPANRDIVTKVYLPKFVLLISKLNVNTIKFFISFLLVVIGMIVFRVPISWNVLYFLPLFIILYLFCFGISSIFMHFGVFVQDLANITTIALRMLFYGSGVFFALSKRVPAPWNGILEDWNPLAAIITQFREVLLNQHGLNFTLMGIWLAVSLLLCFIGIKTIYKYENTYVKVMK